MGFLIVFLGGGLGAALRHGVNLASARMLGTAFPYHTLFENVTGSLVMGLLAGYFASHAVRPEIPEAPHVRTLQLRQARTALPWAARALGLPPPG